MTLVSIVGDSVSTYEGYNPEGYAVFYDNKMQVENRMTSVYDTWWAKVNQAMHAYLCVNNSYSGSKVSGVSFPAATSGERLTNLSTKDYSPDVILIYIGFNDFGNGVKVRRDNTNGNKNLHIFEDAYEHMLVCLKNLYPNTKIVCGTLMRTKIEGNEQWKFPEMFAGIGLENYNDVIRDTVKRQNCYLADVGGLGVRYETLDGSHPTIKGHMTLANAWIMCLKEMNFV